MVTAHWISPKSESSTSPTIVISNVDKSQPLYYDYGGFPPETYKYQHNAPGNPEVAQRVSSLLNDGGITTTFDSQRGWDHGVFVPGMLLDPQAEIPIVAISLDSGMNAAQHIKIGELLRPLRDEGVLIIGSGSSYHNFNTFFAPKGSEARKKGVEESIVFDDWLQETCCEDYEKSRAILSNWRGTAPGSYDAHPAGGEEHFVPLFVAFGAGGSKGKIVGGVGEEGEMAGDILMSNVEFS